MPLVSLEQAKDELRSGGLLVFPTETVYGIGCSPSSHAAVSRLLEYKDRSSDSGMPVLVADSKPLEALIKDPDSTTQELRRKLQNTYWPGPLTIIVELLAEVSFAPGVAAADGSLALRHSSSEIATELATAAGGFLIATSANRKAQAPAKNATEALAVFGDLPVLTDSNANALANNVPSTLVDVRCYPPRILREGVIRLNLGDF